MNAKRILYMLVGLLVVLLVAGIGAGVTRTIYEHKLTELRAAELDARVASARHTAELERNLAEAQSYSRRLGEGLRGAMAVLERGADRPATLRLLANQLDAIAATIEAGPSKGDRGDESRLRSSNTTTQKVSPTKEP